MNLEWLLGRFENAREAPALIWRNEEFSYRWLLERTNYWSGEFGHQGLPPRSVVALETDYSPDACALLLALVQHCTIIVPLSRASAEDRQRFYNIAEVQAAFETADGREWAFKRSYQLVRNPLSQSLFDSGHAGLVLFSSGSTGQSKAALHDFGRLLGKFQQRRRSLRTLAFLLFDHIGGINTLFYVLSNTGTLVVTEERGPDAICALIERHKVELLPTSPTFLNLLLLSEAYRRYDLTSLRMITYGTEVMPESTLTRLHQLFPQVRLLQTYGLTELGILRSQSKGPDSLWVKIKGEGFETKINNGTLWVHARSAMMGYLNAPSPFDSEGWMDTGDAVEVDGDYMRILGRKSDIINVGGEKVYPAQVESVLMQMDNVREIVVFGEKNALLGYIVVAQITPAEPESSADLKQRLEVFASDRLAAYQIPQKIIVSDAVAHSPRFKKIRSQPVAA